MEVWFFVVNMCVLIGMCANVRASLPHPKSPKFPEWRGPPTPRVAILDQGFSHNGTTAFSSLLNMGTLPLLQLQGPLVLQQHLPIQPLGHS